MSAHEHIELARTPPTQESEEQLHLAVEAAGLGTWDYRPLTGELDWSDQCKAIFGLAPDTPVTYARFLECLHPSDHESANKAVQQALDPAGNGKYETEYRAVWPDGSAHWIIAKGRAFFEEVNATRRAHRFVGTVFDNGGRRQAEEALARRTRQAMLTADVGIALAGNNASLQDVLQRCAEALVRHLDAAFARIWTFNKDANMLELQASAGLYTHLDGAHGRVPVGKFKIGLIAEERVPHLTNNVLNDPRVGDVEWAKREGMISFAGYPLKIEDRLVGVIAMFARAPLAEDTLESLHSIANIIAQGIERKRAEIGLEKSEQRYGYLADAMPQFVWTTDADGATTYFNRRWYEYTGLSEEESMGFGFADALHPEDKERVLESWQRAWRSGEHYETEYRFYSRPQGTYRWFLARATSVRDDAGKITQWVGTCTDIEEQKYMEVTLARINQERAELLQEVLTPIVPVWRGVLALPIIGSLDTARMQQAAEAALAEVTRTGARACIIDITGARIIDPHAVTNLSSLASALKLIGAEVIVTGVTAHVAQSLVGLGLDFTGLRTHRTLAEAIYYLVKTTPQHNH